jgi:hypothetical protein
VSKFSVWLVVVSIAFLAALTSIAEAKRQKQARWTSSSVELQVRKAFADTPIMVQIAKCESGFRQYDERGVLLRNKHSSASGVFQVMFSLHYATADKLGFQLETTKGNIGYAKYLYNTQGTNPWNASKHCWGKTTNNHLLSIASQ